jgi:Fic family protein
MGNRKRQIPAFRRNVGPRHPQFVIALARGIAILNSFERSNGLLGNQEIARLTNLPKATVSRLTFTLASLGYLM